MLPHSTVVSPLLVGRAGELQYLQQQLRAACSGSGRCVLVSGEAGVGKSRIVAHLCALAGEQCRVVSFNCYEEDSTSPYAPLIDALRLQVAQVPPPTLVETYGVQLADLLPLLPELSPAAPSSQPDRVRDPASAQRRIYAALLRVLVGTAPHQPRVLVAEDVHWSDAATLGFLQYLIRRITAYPVLVIVTFRHGEAPPMLLKLLAELNRTRAAPELVVPSLERADVALLLRAILALPRPAPPRLVDAIFDVTDGNPFLVEETLQTLLAASDLVVDDGRWVLEPPGLLPIPRSVHDAVQRRVAQLGDEARAVLTVAAVAGRRFGFPLLQAATSLSEAALVERLRELVAAQLLIEQPADQFAFRHALTREAVYRALLRRERTQVHRCVVAALAQVSDARAADLAYHAHEAGLWDDAYRYAQQAGRQALEMHAPREAIRHLSWALDAAQQLSPAQPLTPLYVARGHAYDTLGLFAPARDDYMAALSLTHAQGDTRGEWEASLALGMLWAAHDYEHAVKHFQYALTLARALGDEALIGHSLILQL